MTAEEAISKYTRVYHSKAKEKYTLQFKVEGSWIRMGHVDKDGFTQWYMRSLTPEQLYKMAEMMDLGLEPGDPKKPMTYVKKG